MTARYQPEKKGCGKADPFSRITPADFPREETAHPGDQYAVFNNIFGMLHLGLFKCNPGGDFVRPANADGLDCGLSCVSENEGAPLLVADDRPYLVAAWRTTMGACLEWSSELTYRAADGGAVIVHASIAQIRNSAGEVTGYLGCNVDITAKVAVREEVALSEERHRLALEAACAGLWDIDLIAGIYHVSPRCHEILGYQDGELSTGLEQLKKLVHPEDQETLLSIRSSCHAGDRGFRVELRLKTGTRKWGWFLCQGKAQHDGNGRLARVVGTLVDIGEQKRVEQLNQVEHSLLEVVTGNIPVGLVVIDLEGNLIFANPSAEQILGTSREEMNLSRYRLPVCHLVTRGGKSSHEEELPLREVLAGGSVMPTTCFAIKRPDGERVLLSVNASPFAGADGEPGGTVLVLQDVTEQRHYEQVLADSDRLLSETQRIAQLGSYVLDLAKDRWSCSATLGEILGLEEETPMSLLGHYEIVHPDFRQQFIESYFASIVNAKQFQMEYKITRQSDRVDRWVAECCELKPDESGKLCRMVGTIQDITERKDAEQAIRDLNDELDRRVIERTSQLAAAKKEIESFSYSVSHDLRAPLRHINSYSTILLTEYADQLSEEPRQYLERISTASSRMGKLIDDLLTLTRVGRTEMKRNRFDISKMAEEVASMLSEAEGNTSAEFVVQKGLRAFGDSILVRLVLENLIGNALKYSGNGESRIEFGRTVTDGKAAFYVRDNGVGFDMAFANLLFQPFQRLHGSEFEGTGIGLATVKRIIDRHGGTVWAHGLDQEGATFYFTLPRSPEN